MYKLDKKFPRDRYDLLPSLPGNHRLYFDGRRCNGCGTCCANPVATATSGPARHMHDFRVFDKKRGRWRFETLFACNECHNHIAARADMEQRS